MRIYFLDSMLISETELLGLLNLWVDKVKQVDFF